MSSREGQNPTHITVPVFPLPNAVLFPDTVLPLHVFEARYRQMVADALAGDRRLAIALLKPGWEDDYEGSPAIHSLVGFGVIEAAGKLADGRYLLRLRGEGKGQVAEEVQKKPYRRALLEPRPDRKAPPELGRWAALIESKVRELHGEEGLDKLAASTGSERPSGTALVHAVAAELPVSPETKLGLLALDDPAERARQVAGLLEEGLVQRRAIERHRWRGEFDARLN